MNKIGRLLVPILLTASMAPAQQIQVRMNTRLSSATAKPGTPFSAVLLNATQINGRSCAKGSPVGGVVTEAKGSGRLKNPGVLQLEPTWVSCHERRVSVKADPAVLEGQSHTKKNAVLIGGGAGLGALIGSVFGGGKGALIGAGVGAGAGTVGAAATGKHEAVIEPESIVQWEVKAGSPPPFQSASNRAQQTQQPNAYRQESLRRHHDDEDDDQDGDRYNGDSRRYRFTDHDRVYLSRCLVSNYRLPPGLAKQGKVPPGHAKKMAQAGYAPIPYACTNELSPIPSGWMRVIIDTRVVLFDSARREVDWFVWQRDDGD